MELIESLATLGFAGGAAGASGACESNGADASRSSNAEDASFNFHLVAGFADGRGERGGPNLNISYSVLDAGRQCVVPPNPVDSLLPGRSLNHSMPRKPPIKLLLDPVIARGPMFLHTEAVPAAAIDNAPPAWCRPPSVRHGILQ